MTPARTLAGDLRALATLNRCSHGAAAVFPAANARLRAILEAKMSPYDQILTTTRQIVARHADRAPCDVAEDTVLHAIGIDDWARVEVILDIEDAFAVAIPDEKFDEYKTVQALAHAIAKQRGVPLP